MAQQLNNDEDNSPCSRFAQELMRLREITPDVRKRYNPRPAGWIQPGGSTDTVLKYLRSVDAYRTRKEIMDATGLQEKACNWALLYLRSIKLITFVQDVRRNQQYRRYKIRVVADDADA